MFENQVRQFYVAKEFVGSGIVTNEGDIKLFKTPDGKAFYFQFKDKGGVACTDRIEFDKVRDINICKPAGIAINSYFIQMNDDPKVGEYYILRIEMKNLAGIEGRKLKEAVALAKADDTKDDIYAALVNSFYKNFAREPQNPYTISVGGKPTTLYNGTTAAATFTALKSNVKVELKAAGSADITITTSDGVTTVAITPATGSATKTAIASQIAADDSAKELITIDSVGTYAAVAATPLIYGLTITDKTPEYKENLVEMKETETEIFCSEINVNANTNYAQSLAPWGTVEESRTFTGNARRTAMYERFGMKTRGELNGWLGYPQCDPAEMMIQNPGLNDNFWWLNIAYRFQGEGMVNTFSDKSLTIVVKTTDENTSSKGVFAVPNTSSGTPTSNSLDKIDADATSATVLKASSDFGSANLLYNLLGSDYLNRNIRFVKSK